MNKQTNKTETALLFCNCCLLVPFRSLSWLWDWKKTPQAFCALTELASCQPLSSSHIQEDIFITLPCVQTQEPEQTALLNFFIFSSPSQTKCIIKYREVQTLINLGTLRPLDVGVYFEGISRAVRFSLFACIRFEQPVIISWGCDLPPLGMNETDGLGLARGSDSADDSCASGLPLFALRAACAHIHTVIF